MKNLLLLVCSILFIAPVYNQAQTKFPEIIERNLENYIVNKSSEKVYIQTDKPMYTVGEDIWFTGYLVNAITHQKSVKSKVLYAELINDKDSIVAAKKLYIEQLSVAGDFKIDESWSAGTYTLRGYTNYMKNDSFNSYFQKEIPIYALEKKENNPKEITTIESEKVHNKSKEFSNNVEVSFYPEGGYLVNNLQSKVAFQVKGQEKDFTGLLYDQDNNIVSQVKTVGFARGAFLITPEEGKNYHVKTKVNGKEITFPLPKALSTGHILNLTNTGKSIILNMSSNTLNGLQNTYMTAHQRGVLLFDNFETRTINTNVIKIPTTSLTDGVINFTLFDQDGHPVAERVTFIDNPLDKVNLTINTNKKVFGTREKVNLDIELTTPQGLKEYSFLSMAVRNAEAFPYNSKTDNIKSYLLLTSDLRGEIKNPGYFFEKENTAKKKYLLDLVMLTNGWKRFTWQELLDNTDHKQIYEAEEGIYVTGTTYQADKTDKIIPSVVRMSFLGKFIAQTPVQQTDENGRFKFGPDVYPGNATAMIEARQDDFLDLSKRSRNVSIILDEKPKSPEIDKNTSITLNVNERQEANFLKVNKYVQQIQFEFDQQFEQLQAVELEAKRLSDAEKRKKEMQNRTLYRRPDNILNRIDLENLDDNPGDIFTAIQGNPTVRFDGENFIWNRDNTEALIFLDDRPIDVGILSGIMVDEISFIDILTAPQTSILANTNKAIIALYSNKKRKNIIKETAEKKPGILSFTSEGFYIARKFYAPKNSNDFENIVKNNVNTTLHWEPMLRTSNKSSTKTSFYTNDLVSDYVIVIEGLSINGQPVHAVKTFRVE